MKILYVTMNPINTNTSGNLRNIGLMLGLKDLKAEVDILSLEQDEQSFNYDETLECYRYLVRKELYIRTSPLFKRIRGKKEPGRGTDALVKTKKRWRFVKEIFKWLRDEFLIYDISILNVWNFQGIVWEDYDIVISSSDPKTSHLVAAKLKKHNDFYWIQYWGDPMYSDITVKHNKLKDKWLRIEEEKLLKKADRIIYTSPFTLDEQKKLYEKSSSKMYFAAQACLLSNHEKTIKKTRKEICVGYFGDYKSSVRNIVPLCQSINQSEYLLRIAGVGDMEAKSTERIKIYPRLSHDRVKQLEDKSDVLIGLCNKGGTQIPAKFYYMAGTQKPVIIIVDGDKKIELRKYFNHFQRYIVCGNNQTEIADAIQIAVEQLEEQKKYTTPPELLPVNVADKILKDMWLEEKGNKK